MLYKLNHLKYLCLRLLKAPERSLGMKMQRNLHPDVYYYFYDGITVQENYIDFHSRIPQQLYNLDEQIPSLEINICAIVGENGSGKSTIVDFILRILNNLSVCILGEYYRSPSAEHLHFIENVYAELYVLVEDYILCIRCENEKISAIRYNFNFDTSRFEKVEAPINIDEVLKRGEIAEGKNEKIEVLRNFCYTIVNNYSLYSFNSLNYLDEMTSFKKEAKIRREGKRNGYKIDLLEEIKKKCKKHNNANAINDAQSWLQGLFHKNDGYQVPIVITPMREIGHIDLQKEYKLAKERLLSLIFMKRPDSNEPLFHRINGKLRVDGIYLSKDYNEEAKYKNIDSLWSYLPNTSLEVFHHIYDFIVIIIKSEMLITDEKRNHSILVWNYIVRKILKIILTYPRYFRGRLILLNIKKDFSEEIRETLQNMILDILHDHSHITRKLFRSIYYLKYNHINQQKYLSVKEFSKVIEDIVNNRNNTYFYRPYNIDELLPPPIFHLDFKLYDMNDTKKKYPIQFRNLSSGEKQITYVLSSFYYHLANLDSVSNFGRRIKREKKDIINIYDKRDVIVSTIQYRHVNIIFDKVELYFHPEMQRTFIANLLDGLRQMKFQNLRSIQIMLVTHSPFILSDIPRDNVLFLGKDGYPRLIEDMYTFGANIHSMLKHSFFLYNGSMGEYAQNLIRGIINKINFYNLVIQLKEINKETSLLERKNKLQYFKDSNYRIIKLLPIEMQMMLRRQDIDVIFKEGINEMQSIQQYIEMVQEPIVKYSLEEQYKKWKNYVDTQA